MESNWKLLYWNEDNGISPLEHWFDERTPIQFKGIAKELKLLEKCGNELRLPHSRSLGQGLFELRERTYGYRIYYTFTQNKIIILLQAGDKKTQQHDIKIARDRMSKIGRGSRENEVKKF